MGGFPQSNALFYNFLACAFTAAASAAEWFFIAALSAAMKKNILLCVPCALSGAGGKKHCLTYPHIKAGTISIAEGLRG